jgi:hypothetical protein
VCGWNDFDNVGVREGVSVSMGESQGASGYGCAGVAEAGRG